MKLATVDKNPNFFRSTMWFEKIFPITKVTVIILKVVPLKIKFEKLVKVVQ